MENYKLTYSNLIDRETQDYIKNILIQNGIPQERVNAFITIVENYNLSVNIVGLPTSKPGFTTIDSSQVPYDEQYLDYRWQKNKFDYDDLNCRVTAFGLFGDYIKSPDKLDIILGVPAGPDIAEFEKNPYAKLYDINIEHYGNYYTSAEIGTNLHYKDIPKYIIKSYDERKISYKPNNTISIINVFWYDSYFGDIFVGHAGILVDLKTELLFIEKISPVMPYQVLKFKNRNEIKDFLMDRFKYDEKIIMEDNKLL